MDENLVLYAIQFKERKDFEDRYSVFRSKDDRDKAFAMLTDSKNPLQNKTLEKVQMIVRVETER